MVEKSDLRDLPPDRFGDLVAEVLANGWPGDVDVSPASPGGAVDAVIATEGERRLVHVRRDERVDADVVGDVVVLSAEHAFDATTLATTGEFTEEARRAASVADVTLVDGDEFAVMVEAADVEVDVDDEPTVASLATQLAGRWPEPLREHAVELAMAIDDVTEFDRAVTLGSDRADVDFTPAGDDDPLTRMRFTETSLLVYVRRGPRLESVIRLTAYREDQPSLAEVLEDLEARVRAALDERSDRGS